MTSFGGGKGGASSSEKRREFWVLHPVVFIVHLDGDFLIPGREFGSRDQRQADARRYTPLLVLIYGGLLVVPPVPVPKFSFPSRLPLRVLSRPHL